MNTNNREKKPQLEANFFFGDLGRQEINHFSLKVFTFYLTKNRTYETFIFFFIRRDLKKRENSLFCLYNICYMLNYFDQKAHNEKRYIFSAWDDGNKSDFIIIIIIIQLRIFFLAKPHFHSVNQGNLVSSTTIFRWCDTTTTTRCCDEVENNNFHFSFHSRLVA